MDGTKIPARARLSANSQRRRGRGHQEDKRASSKVGFGGERPRRAVLGTHVRHARSVRFGRHHMRPLDDRFRARDRGGTLLWWL